MIFESSPGTEDNIYSKLLSDKLPLLISQKDVANEGQLMLKPVYMQPFVLVEL